MTTSQRDDDATIEPADERDRRLARERQDGRLADPVESYGTREGRLKQYRRLLREHGSLEAAHTWHMRHWNPGRNE